MQIELTPQTHTNLFWNFWCVSHEGDVQVPKSLAETEGQAMEIGKYLFSCEEAAFDRGEQHGRRAMAGDLRRLIGASEASYLEQSI